MTLTPREHTLRSSDETSIAWYDLGAGPALMTAGGLVGRHVIWKQLWDTLATKCRFIGWDYRGLWRSRRPADFSHFTMRWHLEDQRCVLDASEEDRVVLIGWSTGAQVNFEFYRRWPERVAGIIVLCGTYGRPFEGALNWRGTKHVIPRAARAAEQMQNLVSSTLGRFAGSRHLIRYLKLTGAVGPTADENALCTITEELASVDVPAFMTLVRRMEEQDATDLLETIDVPVLLVAGERDLLIAPRIARKMNRRIPDSDLMIIPGATHYAPIEHGDLIALRIEKFLRDLKYIPSEEADS